MTVETELFGRLLRELQAQMRTLRDEHRLLREELATKVTREELYRMAAIVTDRFVELESHIDNRFDALDERLARIEGKL